MSTQAQILAQKRQALGQIQSTIPLSAGTQSTHSRTVQVDTPQPLPAYPAPAALPMTIVQYQVPAGMSGAISSLAIVHLGAAGSFTDGSGVLLWRLLKNGVPQKGLENLYVQIGSQTQLAQMFMLLQENDLIQITVQVPAGKVAPVGFPFARMLGYLDFGGLGAKPPQGNATEAAAPVPVVGVGSSSGGGVGSGGSGYTGGGTGGGTGGHPRFLTL
jgi:hypothetical protein